MKQNKLIAMVDRKCLKLAKSSVVLVCITFLIACNTSREYGQQEGVTFIAPIGDPPAENIVWSPNDEEAILVTASEVGAGPAQIYILNINTREKTDLAHTDYGNLNGMSWTPDGNRVIISAGKDTKGYESGGAWIYDIEDGSIEHLDEIGFSALSPDGATIATLTFIRSSGSSPRGVSLHLEDRKTGRDEIIFTDDTAEWFFGLSWSPNGRQLVFSSGRIGDSNIFVLDMQTRRTVQITSGNYGRYFPVWSPKENVIAYQKAYYKENTFISSINLIDVTGKCDLELPRIEFALSPTWSPDGMKLAFIGPDGIYTIEIEKFNEETKFIEACQS